MIAQSLTRTHEVPMFLAKLVVGALLLVAIALVMRSLSRPRAARPTQPIGGSGKASGSDRRPSAQ